MNLVEYNGTHGPTVREKIVSIVNARTRTQPTVDLSGVMVTLSHSHVADPDTDPSTALAKACVAGDLLRVEHPTRGREVLAEPTPAAFRVALGGDPTPERVRAAIQQEADGEARQAYIGALNQLLQEIQV